jgi:drug/metabolite transporter (DMT)-like permease
MTESSQHRWSLPIAFGLVYLFWGSTYLGIAIAVEKIPPALMCATRFLIAGILMLAYCGLRGRKIFYTPRQLWHMAVVGTLLLMGGNLTLSYAEQVVPSGLSALLIAVTPLWFLVLDTWLLGDHHISRRGLAGLALGIVGMIVLLWPKLTATGTIGRRELWFSLSLLGGSFSWALGSILSKVWQSTDLDPFSATAWQVIFAGIGNLIFALLNGDVARGLDPAWHRRRALSGCWWFVGGLHVLHLAAAPRAEFQGFDLRVRQSSSCRLSRLASAARATGSLHLDGQRDRRRFRNPGDER